MTREEWEKRRSLPPFWIYSQERLNRAYCLGELAGTPHTAGTNERDYVVLVTVHCDDFRIPGLFYAIARYKTEEQAEFAVKQCIETERNRPADWYTMPEQDEIERLMRLASQQ